MMIPFEWDVRVSSKDHTVTALTSGATSQATARYTTMRDSTNRICAVTGDAHHGTLVLRAGLMPHLVW